MSDNTREQELLFARTLEKVMKLAKKQQFVISEEQVREEFAELSFSEEQFEMVFDYLRKHKVGIGEPVNPDDYLNEDDVNYLEMYLRELKELPEASDGEKEAYLLSAMAGEKAAAQKLIEIFLPQVVEIAKLYAGQGVFMEDLIGEGNMALTVGVTMLGCVETAVEAEGLIGKMLMDAMEDLIAESGTQDTGGKEIAAKADALYKQAKELSESLLRKVTVEELAGECELSEDEIRDVLQAMGGTMDYIEEETGNEQ